MSSCTFDRIVNDKDAIIILKYRTMDNLFLKTMKEEKMKLEKRASLLSLEKNIFLAEQLQKETDDLEILIKEHDVLLRACLKLQLKPVHAIVYLKKYKMIGNLTEQADAIIELLLNFDYVVDGQSHNNDGKIPKNDGNMNDNNNETENNEHNKKNEQQ